MQTHRIGSSMLGATLTVLGTLCGCGLGVIGFIPELVLDQHNLLEGPLTAQSIGRLSDVDGSPDPSGMSFDLQSAQTFTAGADGPLTIIQVALLNLDGATASVVLELRETVFDPMTLTHSPSEDDTTAGLLGEVTLPASAFVDVDPLDHDTWPAFNMSFLGVELVAGDTYCFSLRTTDVLGLQVPPESPSTYSAGAAWRRNRALTPGWTQQLGADLGFRVFVTKQ